MLSYKRLNTYVNNHKNMLMRKMVKHSIVLVCDHGMDSELLGDAIGSSLREVAHLKSYTSISSASSCIAKDFAKVIVLCVRTFETHHVEFVQLIKRIHPRAEILLVLDGGFKNISAMLSTGVAGIALRSSGIASITQSVNDMWVTGSYLSPAVARLLVQEFWINQNSPLSTRETQVLKLVTEGKSYTEIAERLKLSSETIKSHLRNIYKKLNVKSKSEVVSKAFYERLVPVGQFFDDEHSMKPA